MSSERQQWTQLADELGLAFKPGVRGMLESKIAGRIAAQQGQDPAQIAKVMQNPLIMGVLERVFLGVAMGTYRDYEFFVYRNSKSHSDSSTTSYSVHVQLFWPEAVELGLSIYRERFWSKVGKVFGAQDLQTGHPELDPLVMVKAGVPERVQSLIELHEMQQALLELFRDGDEFEVDDQGIEHRSLGQRFLPAGAVRPLMDRMVAAADVMWSLVEKT
ncbi:MAG: hypothetical protein JRI23_11930 [Deltaproteobacteria bacterium]|jgi:hypothetical protein|nr:hypothetical protein [Deltaproteobacteria bacterium]MBW2532417.1 hypothetical protein [Deltaproteobacteria bacterium]